MKEITYTVLFEDFKGGRLIRVFKPSEFKAPFLFCVSTGGEDKGEWSTFANPQNDSTYSDAYVVREAIRRIDN